MAPAKKPPAAAAKPAPKKKGVPKPPLAQPPGWHSCRMCDYDACAACFARGAARHPHGLVANRAGALSAARELLRKCDECGARNPRPNKPKPQPKPLPRKKPVAKKPIIYLYPSAPCEATVHLALRAPRATLGPLLPAPAHSLPSAATWRVAAQPDGTLQPLAGGPPVASLFWEATGAAPPSALLPRGARDTFCVPGAGAGAWLLGALRAQGLSAREYTECASFWAPDMARHAFVVLRLVPQAQWEALAPLAVAGLPPGAPTRTLRVFVAWRGVPAYLPGADLGALPAAPPPARSASENWIVEWGGQEC